MAGIVGQAARSLPFALAQPTWLAGPVGIDLGLVMIPVAGALWIGRGGTRPLRQRARPALLLRIEDEQRLAHEQRLLGQLQERLQPTSLPAIDGWELAARRIPAFETGSDVLDVALDGRGGLWVLGADVEGRSYSCAVSQSVATAAFAVLANEAREPRALLAGIRQVLDSAPQPVPTRSAALRLSYDTGAFRAATDGGPSPITIEGAALEGTIDAGGVLLLATDGLYAGLAGGNVARGLEDCRRLLARRPFRSAQECVDAVLAEWRVRLGDEAPEDDALLFVARRAPNTG